MQVKQWRESPERAKLVQQIQQLQALKLQLVEDASDATTTGNALAAASAVLALASAAAALVPNPPLAFLLAYQSAVAAIGAAVMYQKANDLTSQAAQVQNDIDTLQNQLINGNWIEYRTIVADYRWTLWSPWLGTGNITMTTGGAPLWKCIGGGGGATPGT